MSWSKRSEFQWAGLVLAVPGPAYLMYQIMRPEGHLTIEYERQDPYGRYELLAKPRFPYAIMDLQLRGELGRWDGQQRPVRLEPLAIESDGPLTLPPTPGYTEHVPQGP